MSTSMRLLWRRHGFFIFAVPAMSNLSIVSREAAHFISLGLFFWFLYRLNVEDRLRKTWHHFQSLPLSLAERAMARIAVPLLVGMAADTIVGNISGHGPALLVSITWSLLYYALVILASLVATTAVRFLFLGVVGFMAAGAIVTVLPGYVAFFSVFPIVAWSVVVLSGKRTPFLKLGVPASLIGAAVAAALAWAVGWPAVQENQRDIIKFSWKSTTEVKVTTKETHQFVDDAGRTWEVESTKTRRLVPEATPGEAQVERLEESAQ